MVFGFEAAPMRSLSLSILVVLAVSDAALGQSPLPALGVVRREHAQASVPNLKAPGSQDALAARTLVTLSSYLDPVQGSSSDELVRRALAANAELSAVRLDIERGRARLRQAGLRPNPTV
jgi:hypothetical protein